MKCPYCSNEMSLFKKHTHTFICEFCKISALIENDVALDTWWDFDKYTLCINFERKFSSLYTLNNVYITEPLIHFDYVIDINPINKQYWLDKLLNLQIFS